MTGSGCRCERGQAPDRLPSRYLVGYDEHWTAVHAHSSGLLGWLVLAPRRHVLELAELTDDEAARLGVWQTRLARVLTAELHSSKTYVVRFGEVPGHHLHFHIVARPPELDAQLHGPGIFGYLGPGEDEKVSDTERQELAERLSARL